MRPTPWACSASLRGAGYSAVLFALRGRPPRPDFVSSTGAVITGSGAAVLAAAAFRRPCPRPMLLANSERWAA